MKNYILLFSAMLLVGISSCKKNEELQPETTNQTTQTAFSFNSLKAEKTGIVIGEEVTITADATGDNLTYNWQASAGTIVGEGKQVSYGSTCTSCKGDNTISCTVSDGKTSETKSIVISIKG